MKKHSLSRRNSTLAAVALIAFGVGTASAQLGRILKVGGAIAIADHLGPQIDSVLNKVTGQKNLAGAGIATKIVPLTGSARVLIPIATRSVTNAKRVPGVGVSAIIDIKL